VPSAPVVNIGIQHLDSSWFPFVMSLFRLLWRVSTNRNESTWLTSGRLILVGIMLCVCLILVTWPRRWMLTFTFTFIFHRSNTRAGRTEYEIGPYNTTQHNTTQYQNSIAQYILSHSNCYVHFTMWVLQIVVSQIVHTYATCSGLLFTAIHHLSFLTISAVLHSDYLT